MNFQKFISYNVLLSELCIYPGALARFAKHSRFFLSHDNLKKKINISVYANYFYDTSVIFSNYIITYREPFTICIGHDRRTDVIGIDWYFMD